MSQVFDALRRSELERTRTRSEGGSPAEMSSALLGTVEANSIDLEHIHPLRLHLPPGSRLVTLVGTSGLEVEKFGLLVERLKRLQDGRRVKTMLITSSIAGEGKSLIAANLAVMLARRTRQRVLLIGGDLRQPALEQIFGVGKLAGLGDFLQGSDSIVKFLYRLGQMSLWFLPAGTLPTHPLDLLQMKQLPELLARLSGWFDCVLVDSPPLLPLADADVWARLVDGVLLVVREGSTQKKSLQKALETLEGCGLLGVILNHTRASEDQYYSRYYARPAGRQDGQSGRHKTRVNP